MPNAASCTPSKACPSVGWWNAAWLGLAGQVSQAIEELRALTQYQPAARPFGIPGVAAQKIVNTFLARYFSPTKPASRAWSDGRGGDEQSGRQGVEVKAPVKPVGKGGQIA